MDIRAAPNLRKTQPAKNTRSKLAPSPLKITVFTVFLSPGVAQQLVFVAGYVFLQGRVGSQDSCFSRMWKNSSRVMHYTEVF